MKALIDLFWSKYADLRRAIDSEDEAAMAALDRELDPLMLAIFGSEARDPQGIQAQFAFALDLLNEEADDRCCVRRNAHLLQTLVERYLAPQGSEKKRPHQDSEAGPAIEDVTAGGILDEALLDDLSERVLVIAPSYRILYSNETNARRLNTAREALVGRHIAEFVGVHRFKNEFQPNLDRCFTGDTSSVTYAEDAQGQTTVMVCRMSPFARSSTLIGALLVIQETADRRRRPAA